MIPELHVTGHALRRLRERLGVHVPFRVGVRAIRAAFAAAFLDRRLIPHYQDGQVRVRLSISGRLGWVVIRNAREDHRRLVAVTVLDDSHFQELPR